MTYIMNEVANALHTGLKTAGGYAANAANRANGVSAAAQSAQGTYNAGQAALANNITSQNLATQYDYNSAQAAIANQFSQQMWQQTADWNEAMWEKQAEFNRIEAQKNRDWQEHMRETAYQTAVADMEKAGINPILAAGGITASAGGGSAASVGGASMSPIAGQMASGGVIGGQAASESSYTGQMEYMSGILGLFSTAMAGLTSAMKAMDSSGTQEMAKTFGEILLDYAKDKVKNSFQIIPGSPADKVNKAIKGVEKSKQISGKY